MRIRKRFSVGIRLLVLFTPLLLASCQSNPLAADNPTIDAGTARQLITAPIGVSGGRLIVNTPGDTLNGLEIVVPNRAYDASRTFTISSAPITGNRLGPYFNPISPLITISNGGGYSDKLMTLRIPVRVPAGHFAMAFLYDRHTGKVEGMPLLESDTDHVTVFTRNFSNSVLTGLGKLSSMSATDVELSEIVVASVDESSLLGDIQSDFTIGVDNWQFVNWGSYTSPKGNCSGHSIGMLWYYNRKKASGGPLYGRFDNNGSDKTPAIWADDGDAIKFVSALQNEWSFSADNMKLINWQWRNDWKTERCFAYSILVTHEPQLMLVTDTNGIGKGSHAVVVYRINKGMLFIADPNFPFEDGKYRRAEYDPKLRLYSAYFTGPNGTQNDKPYTDFVYLAKTSVASWTTADAHWKEMSAGTLGRNEFPTYTIMARNEQNDYVPLVDGMSLTSPITIDVRGNGFPAHFIVFERPYGILANDTRDIELPPGERMLGFCVSDTICPYAPASIQHWVGFKWVRVRITGSGTGQPYEPPQRGKLHMNVGDSDGTHLIDSASYYFDGSGLIISWDRHDCAAGGMISFGSVTHVGTYPLITAVDIGKDCFNYDGGTGTATVSQWGSGFAGSFSFEYNKGSHGVASGTFSYP
ncbi:MAG: hypothetical protein ABIQ57_08625 [Candidatus Kapaibacterium sp.]